MLNSLYEIGKLWIEEEDLDKIEILLDSDKLKKTKSVILVEFKNSNSIIEYDRVMIKEFSLLDAPNYLYKKGSSRGTNLSPSALITEPEKTFDKKFSKWFENYKNDEFIFNVFNEIKKNRDEILEKIINLYNGLEDKTNVLLTLSFNDRENVKFINEYTIFKNIIVEKSAERYYKIGSKNIKGEGVCSLCDNEKKVFGLVPTSIGLKFSTTDKKGNLPDVDLLNQWKQVPICMNCALFLEAGKKFVEKHLSFSEFGLRYMIIPNFLFRSTNEGFKELYKHIKNIENKKYQDVLVSEEKDLAELIGELDDILEFKFLFYESSNNAFNILGYVESILPSWINKIYETQIKIKDRWLFSEHNMKSLFGEKNEGDFIEINLKNRKFNKINKFNWYMGFLRDFFPIKTDNKFYIDIISSIISNKKISYNFLISNLLNLIRKNYRQNNTYGLYVNVIESFMLLLLFKNLNLFNGDEKMELKDEENKEDFYEEYSDILNAPDKKASFLLGILTRKLMSVQYMELKSTPFFNKLWGLSLDKTKIQKLYPMVLNKLREYKIAYPSLEEDISINLLNTNNNWNLTRDETSFYFVLGYTLSKVFKLNKKGDEDE